MTIDDLFRPYPGDHQRTFPPRQVSRHNRLSPCPTRNQRHSIHRIADCRHYLRADDPIATNSTII